MTKSNYFATTQKIRNPPASDLGETAFSLYSVVCQNEHCGRMSLSMKLSSREDYAAGDGFRVNETLHQWSLLPESSARPQPDYIPEALVADYVEACRIRDLSPKASATLARRCLQGMIRDFCKISKKTLNEEIQALRKAVDENLVPAGVTAESVDGIDAVRKVGNIGAHMEADVNTIIDIDPGEAQVLIELVETLFEEWYVARHKRARRFASVKALAETKKKEIAEAKKKALPAPARIVSGAAK